MVTTRKLGQVVQWMSRGGVRRTKTGEVIEVVPAGQFPALYAATGRAAPRQHESYVVCATDAHGNRAAKVYWPRVSALRSDDIAPEPTPGLTVGDLATQLADLVAAGHQGKMVVIPYDPGVLTLGASPAVAVTHVHLGFDWNAGKLHLTPQRPLALSGAELQRRRRRAEAQAALIYGVRRVLDNPERLPAEDVLAELRRILATTRGT